MSNTTRLTIGTNVEDNFYTVIRLNSNGSAEYFKSFVGKYDENDNLLEVLHVYWKTEPSFEMTEELAKSYIEDLKPYYSGSNCEVYAVKLNKIYNEVEVI